MKQKPTLICLRVSGRSIEKSSLSVSNGHASAMTSVAPCPLALALCPVRPPFALFVQTLPPKLLAEAVSGLAAVSAAAASGRVGEERSCCWMLRERWAALLTPEPRSARDAAMSLQCSSSAAIRSKPGSILPRLARCADCRVGWVGGPETETDEEGEVPISTNLESQNFELSSSRYRGLFDPTRENVVVPPTSPVPVVPSWLQAGFGTTVATVVTCEKRV